MRFCILITKSNALAFIKQKQKFLLIINPYRRPAESITKSNSLHLKFYETKSQNCSYWIPVDILPNNSLNPSDILYHDRSIDPPIRRFCDTNAFAFIIQKQKFLLIIHPSRRPAESITKSNAFDFMKSNPFDFMEQNQSFLLIMNPCRRPAESITKSNAFDFMKQNPIHSILWNKIKVFCSYWIPVDVLPNNHLNPSDILYRDWSTDPPIRRFCDIAKEISLTNQPEAPTWC